MTVMRWSPPTFVGDAPLRATRLNVSLPPVSRTAPVDREGVSVTADRVVSEERWSPPDLKAPLCACRSGMRSGAVGSHLARGGAARPCDPHPSVAPSREDPRL
jgi:hypothetical protein